MAKRKKAKTSKRRPLTRRRMGALPGKNDFEEAIGLVAASVGGTIIQRMIPASVSPKLIAAGQMALGWWMKNNHEGVMRGAGYGLLGTGAISMTHDLGIINGIEDLVSGVFDNQQYMQLPVRQIQGFSNESRVNGFANESRVSSVDGQMPTDYFSPIGM